VVGVDSEDRAGYDFVQMEEVEGGDTQGGMTTLPAETRQDGSRKRYNEWGDEIQ
jgi:hypothetical protein